MTLEFTSLNWVAVIAAAVVGMLIGGTWYAPQLFGKRWSAAVGREPVGFNNMTPMVWVGAPLMPVVMAYVLTLLISGLDASSTNAVTLVDGAIVGFLAALGFSAMASLNAFVYDGRNSTWFAVTVGYQIVVLTVMGAIIGYLGA